MITPTARPEDARQTNLRLAFQEVLTAREPISRAEIAARIGLTRATISRLIDELIEAGFVLEHAPSSSSAGTLGRGRPSKPLTLNASRFIAIGIEVAVSCARVVGIDLKGHSRFSHRFEVGPASHPPELILRKIGQYIDSECGALGITQRELVGAALAIPGLVEAGSQRILHTPNLDWDGTIPTNMLCSTCVPQLDHVLNEADAAAMTSAYVRPAVTGELENFLYITGEIGIGGALIFHHDLYRGPHGWAGELGHVIVNPKGPACQCGSHGCLEQYLGRRAISTNCGFERLASNLEIREAVLKGDAQAEIGMAIAGEALGTALTSVTNLVDIDLAVIGGPLAGLTDLLVPHAKRVMNKRLMAPHRGQPQFQTAALGGEAAATGAAYSLLNRQIARLVEHV